MTTIAVKNGIMAADSRESFGEPGSEHCGTCKKIFNVNGIEGFEYCVVGMSGESVAGLIALNSLPGLLANTGELRSLFASGSADFNMLVLAEKNGLQKLLWFDAWCFGIPIESRCWAIGSGAKVALGAMAAGATAARAVSIAIELDPYSGGKVWTSSPGAPCPNLFNPYPCPNLFNP